MTAREALNILDTAASAAPLTRAQHVTVQMAVKMLNESIALSEEFDKQMAEKAAVKEKASVTD